MAKGGIFDQIGGGFHRYSTDSRWLVPHFEKMLYDNALIPVNYAEAYQIAHDPFYLDIMKKTLDFVLREITSPDGAFYSALDADSQGQEGKFYVWTKSEINSILGQDSRLFCLYYDVTDGGNWEGQSILCNNLNLSAAAFACSLSEGDARDIIARCEQKLLTAREGRPRPGLDDKILACWNGMMITALARGYRVAGKQEYLDAARRALHFMINSMMDKQGLFRVYKGKASIRGFLEDYACVCGALLDVFEEYPDELYLSTALRLGELMLEYFWDAKEGRFFMTPKDHETLIMRPASEYDLATPSGSSVAIASMMRLYQITAQKKFLDAAVRALETKMRPASENPFAFGYLLNAAYMHLQGVTEITVLNTENKDIQNMLANKFMPETITVKVQSAAQAQSLAEYPFFAGKEFGENTRVYICRNSSCSAPLSTIQQIETLL